MNTQEIFDACLRLQHQKTQLGKPPKGVIELTTQQCAELAAYFNAYSRYLITDTDMKEPSKLGMKIYGINVKVKN